jgi:hypothetical protein
MTYSIYKKAIMLLVSRMMKKRLTNHLWLQT